MIRGAGSQFLLIVSSWAGQERRKSTFCKTAKSNRAFSALSQAHNAEDQAKFGMSRQMLPDTFVYSASVRMCTASLKTRCWQCRTWDFTGHCSYTCGWHVCSFIVHWCAESIVLWAFWQSIQQNPSAKQTKRPPLMAFVGIRWMASVEISATKHSDNLKLWWAVKSLPAHSGPVARWQCHYGCSLPPSFCQECKIAKGSAIIPNFQQEAILNHISLLNSCILMKL